MTKDVVCPQWWGAKGNGIHNDTAAIQAAINAAPPNGVVHLPRGRYRITSPLDPGAKCVTLEGVDGRMLANDPYGAAVWTDNPGAVSGSVIVVTQTTGAGIQNTNIGSEVTCVRLRDLALVGPGTGDTVGVHLGNVLRANIGSILHNVSVANFATGFKFVATYEMTCSHLWARGCDVGMDVGADMGVNQAVFVNTMIERCHTIGIHIHGGMNQSWVGGLMQSNEAEGLVADALETSSFDAWHFENPTITGPDIRVEDAQSSFVVRNSRVSTSPAGGIRVNNGRRVTFENIRMMNGQVYIGPSAHLTMFSQCNLPPGCMTDLSTSTIYLMDSALVPGIVRLKAGAYLMTLSGVKSISGSGVDAKNLWDRVVFPGAPTRLVTFPEPEPDNEYMIQLTGNANETFWVTDKTVNGFTIHSSNPTSAASVEWFLVH